MIFLNCIHISEFSFSDAADISNIVIAVLTLCLSFYVFVYQRQKDKKDKLETLRLQEQNIRLQWFKELIVQPHLSDINSFYDSLRNYIEVTITTNKLPEETKSQITEFIKTKQSELRKKFVDVLHGVNKQLYESVITNLDNLTDEITNTIFNDGFNLTHKPTYEKEIGSKITYSRNDLLSKIYNYKGI